MAKWAEFPIQRHDTAPTIVTVDGRIFPGAQVWDQDIGRDDMIGTFSFDLDRVREREGKTYYKAWVTLYNPSDDSEKGKGPQGQLLVSVTVLEAGDELAQRPPSNRATATAEEGEGAPIASLPTNRVMQDSSSGYVVA